MKRRTILLLFALVACVLMAGAYICYILFAPVFKAPQTAYVFLDRDDTADSVYVKLQEKGQASTLQGIRLMARVKNQKNTVPTGKFRIEPGSNAWTVFSTIYRGHQTPVRLTVGSPRTLEQLAASLGQQLMIDSLEILQVMQDSVRYQRMGYSHAMKACVILPNTYEVYWNISAGRLMDRFEREHRLFWNKDRLAKAQGLGLTPGEAYTLASVVDEETNKSDEKPVIAGLYLNRLHRGMLLQADPTVKYAVGDFSVRRITSDMLETDSPYNTYKYVGLPPGPVRIATLRGIDSVLNPARHNYLYMCAKEDFSGYHNFAVTHSEHIRNAKKYWRALNQRKIFK